MEDLKPLINDVITLEQEIKLLKKELIREKQEHEMLKQAEAYFVKEMQ